MVYIIYSIARIELPDERGKFPNSVYRLGRYLTAFLILQYTLLISRRQALQDGIVLALYVSP